MQPFAFELVCFNPKLIANFKDSLVLRRPKNDDRDAWDVAARLRFGEWPVSYVPSDFWQGLRHLTRYRFHLARSLTRREMRFRSVAFLKSQRLETGQALCRHDELAEMIRHRGRDRFDYPFATAQRPLDALNAHIGSLDKWTGHVRCPPQADRLAACPH